MGNPLQWRGYAVIIIISNDARASYVATKQCVTEAQRPKSAEKIKSLFILHSFKCWVSAHRESFFLIYSFASAVDLFCSAAMRSSVI